MLFSNVRPVCYYVDLYRTETPVMNAGPKRSEVYKLMYITRGSCYVKCAGNEYLLTKGSFFHTPPGVDYMTDIYDRLETVNIYFCYAEAEDAPVGKDWTRYLLFDRSSDVKPALDFEDYPMFCGVFDLHDTFGGEALIAGMLREHSRSLLMSGNYTSALLSCLLIDMAHASSVGCRCGGTAETVISFINDNIETDMTCRQIAKKLGYHQNHLNSVIKSACGVSLRAYINNKKTERATGLLENTSLSVTEIAYRLHKSVRQGLQTRDRSRPVRFQKTSVRKNHRRLTEQNNPLSKHGQGTCH